MALFVTGCHSVPSVVNPSFDITVPQARAALEQLCTTAKPKLDRPLVICGGHWDFGFGPWLMRRTLSQYVDGPILCVSFATIDSLQEGRERLVKRIETDLGKGDANTTVEVDVIGQSLGGMIAVYSALDDASLGKRVRIRRLYTICSPLQGAKEATWLPFDLFGYQRDLRPGSALCERLRTTPIDYELISYARLRDRAVGEQYASLPGHPLWWVDTPADEDAHGGADFDARILLEIVRRLRRDAPLTREPATPLPASSADN
ncbi:MAG: hypothetical protein QM770_14780 [Tepidisphaeraceae bacterium]